MVTDTYNILYVLLMGFINQLNYDRGATLYQPLHLQLIWLQGPAKTSQETWSHAATWGHVRRGATIAFMGK